MQHRQAQQEHLRPHQPLPWLCRLRNLEDSPLPWLLRPMQQPLQHLRHQWLHQQQHLQSLSRTLAHTGLLHLHLWSR